MSMMMIWMMIRISMVMMIMRIKTMKSLMTRRLPLYLMNCSMPVARPVMAPRHSGHLAEGSLDLCSV